MRIEHSRGNRMHLFRARSRSTKPGSVPLSQIIRPALADIASHPEIICRVARLDAAKSCRAQRFENLAVRMVLLRKPEIRPPPRAANQPEECDVANRVPALLIICPTSNADIIFFDSGRDVGP